MKWPWRKRPPAVQLILTRTTATPVLWTADSSPDTTAVREVLTRWWG